MSIRSYDDTDGITDDDEYDNIHTEVDDVPMDGEDFDADDNDIEEKEEEPQKPTEPRIKSYHARYSSVNRCKNCQGARRRPAVHCRFNLQTKKFTDNCSSPNCMCRCRVQFLGPDGTWCNIFKEG